MFSKNQQGSKISEDVKAIGGAVGSLFGQVEKMLHEAKEQAVTPEEKMKIARELKKSGVLKHIEELKEKFKEINQ
jgi:hypothetical protein